MNEQMKNDEWKHNMHVSCMDMCVMCGHDLLAIPLHLEDLVFANALPTHLDNMKLEVFPQDVFNARVEAFPFVGVKRLVAQVIDWLNAFLSFHGTSLPGNHHGMLGSHPMSCCTRDLAHCLRAHHHHVN